MDNDNIISVPAKFEYTTGLSPYRPRAFADFRKKNMAGRLFFVFMYI